MALTITISFFMRLKSDLAHHQPLAKFLAFKLVVSLTFIENVSCPPLEAPSIPDIAYGPG